MTEHTEIYLDAWKCFDNGHTLIKAFKEIHGESYRQTIKRALHDAHRRHNAIQNTHKLVIIESPYSGAIERNMAYLTMAIRHSILLGESPYASHLMLTGALDDKIPAEREKGIAAGFAWGPMADKVAVYRDLGISDGMRTAIQHHKDNGRVIEYRNILKLKDKEPQK